MTQIEAHPLSAHWLRGAWLPHVLGTALARLPGSPWVSLPFAAVRVGTAGVLVVAESNAGKTTLLAHMLQASPDGSTLPIDDNETVFDRSGRAVALRRPMMLRPETTRRLGADAARLGRWYRFGSEDLLLQPYARLPVFKRTAIDAVILLERSPGAVPALEDIPMDQADIEVAERLRQRLGRVPDARQLVRLGSILRGARLGQFRLRYESARDGVALLRSLGENKRQN